MPANQPGPPPVNRSAVARTGPTGVSTAEATYAAVADALRSNQSAEVRAFRAMLGSADNANRFLAVAMAALAKNSDILQKATPISLVQSIKDAAALGLEPMTDECAIVVYGNTAKAMPMWRGYIKRIRNSGKVSEIDCQLVYEADTFEMSLGTNPSINHIPARIVKDPQTGDVVQDRGNYYGAYAWALMPSGKTLIEFMSVAEIEEVRRQFARSPRSGEKGPWDTSWGEMARKTVIRRLAKRLPGDAVDRLLEMDKAGDEAAVAVQQEVAKFRDDLADVRQIALNRVGALPAGEQVQPVAPVEPPPVVADAPTHDAGQTHFVGDDCPGGHRNDPAADPLPPDLAAGMALLDQPPDRRPRR